MKTTILRLGLGLMMAALSLGCGASNDLPSWTFEPDSDDETVDPLDPPTDPDPEDADEETAIGVAQGALSSDHCPKRSTTLSPKGLTFVIHVSKHYGDAAYKQLSRVSHLIRARDIFMIERNDDAVKKIREKFPCNAIHYIAYPDEVANAWELGHAIDGVAMDWETQTFSHSQGWTVDKLRDFSVKVRNHGKRPSVVPYWPESFDDGHIVKAAKLDYDLAQIQKSCVTSPLAFATAARALNQNFVRNGLSARDVGFEISLNSFDHADNHTGVDRSAACTRKAYGKGARAIYLYGNGHPHLEDYFHEMRQLGLRVPK